VAVAHKCAEEADVVKVAVPSVTEVPECSSDDLQSVRVDEQRAVALDIVAWQKVLESETTSILVVQTLEMSNWEGPGGHQSYCVGMRAENVQNTESQVTQGDEEVDRMQVGDDLAVEPVGIDTPWSTEEDWLQIPADAASRKVYGNSNHDRKRSRHPEEILLVDETELELGSQWSKGFH